MVKNIKYIIKRILIGVGIALILAALKGGLILNTQAKEISSIFNQIPDGNSQTVNNMTQYVNFNFNSGHWSNWGYGILRFNFSIIKVGGSSLAPLVVPSNVSATNFACDVSSTSTSNSTFTGSTYSASCPMIMGPNGLEFISIALTDNQQNEQGVYRITMGSLLTFEKIEDVTLDTSSTNSAINNQTQNDNNNTQSIINNQNTNKQDIINNQKQNTQDIINNQNANTQAQIESQKSCIDITKENVKDDGKYLDSTGNVVVASGWIISDYINVNNSTIEKLGQSGKSPSICYYDKSKTLISCISNSNVPTGMITPPNDTYYIRVSIEKTGNKPKYKICTNGNQAIVNSQHEINNTLNDDSGGEVSSSFFDDFNVDSNSPVSDLLTMPITLLQAYIDGFSGTCRDINLGRLYGHNLIMPCINPGSYLGTELWSLIDSLFTIFMIYNIAMLCITIYEGITSLHDDFSWLYGVEARHAAVPTRVERNSDLY